MTGPLAPRVVDCPSGNTYKVSVTGLAFCIIRHEKHYVDQPPPVAFPPLVPYGTKGGMHFQRPQGGCKGFRCPRQRHIKLPSEPARSVGRTHRSVRSTRTIEPGRRKAPEPSSPKGTCPYSASHQRGKTPKWYMKYMTRCFSPQIPRFPLRGMPRRGKGCTRQSADLTPHRYPDRQSAACVIFASYPCARPAAADTKKTAPFQRRRFAAVIWLFLQELLLFLLYRKISS